MLIYVEWSNQGKTEHNKCNNNPDEPRTWKHFVWLDKQLRERKRPPDHYLRPSWVVRKAKEK